MAGILLGKGFDGEHPECNEAGAVLMHGGYTTKECPVCKSYFLVSRASALRISTCGQGKCGGNQLLGSQSR